MKIVISQPMYFPWIGMFEQVRLCDLFIYYDDVQFSKGSFTNRVQIKSNDHEGFKWLTVPLKSFKLGQKINEIEIDENKNWRNQHLELLKQLYKDAPNKMEMISIVEHLFSLQHLKTISDLSKASMELVFEYYKLNTNKQFLTSSELAIVGNSSQRVFDLVKHFSGSEYITGHGAKNYLDHELFEKNGISVEYMDYERTSYPQQFGIFNPHVSILDLIANVGKEGKKYIISKTKNWRAFLNESERTI